MSGKADVSSVSALETDVSDIKSNYVKSEDISDFVKNADLETQLVPLAKDISDIGADLFSVKADYVKSADLNTKVDQAAYDTKVQDFATKINTNTTDISFIKQQLPGYAKVTDVLTLSEGVGRLNTDVGSLSDGLNQFTVQVSSTYATKNQLNDYAKTSALDTKASVDSVDLLSEGVGRINSDLNGLTASHNNFTVEVGSFRNTFARGQSDNDGYVLTLTSDGYKWRPAAKEDISGASEGQILTVKDGQAIWTTPNEALPSVGSFLLKSQSGIVAENGKNVYFTISASESGFLFKTADGRYLSSAGALSANSSPLTVQKLSKNSFNISGITYTVVGSIKGFPQ